MANVLKMTMVEAIHSLRSAGLSCREIARRLGLQLPRRLKRIDRPAQM